MTQLKYMQVDVFSNEYYKGNPVAVVFGADDLTDQQMKDIARWMNLSETTFVCQPKNELADYRLRIFTPNNELPFAGHPTVGASFAVLQNGTIPKNEHYLIQESGIGLVKIDFDQSKTFFSLPEPKVFEIETAQLNGIVKSLDLKIQDIERAEKVNIGAEWLTLQLKDAKTVKDLQPNFELMSKFIDPGTTGVTVFGAYDYEDDSQFEVRSFAPNEGVNEDPVCGSGNGCVAVMVERYDLVKGNEYTNTQGCCIGRNGKVNIKQDDTLKIGGTSRIVINGSIIVE
ncbi:PhzF family phenazine biosynthesis protein [Staphylococcus warneri]|uniref:PhzF family phenazine biosynthesis protein n=1 Tax=Staphylococcus warneri TaxID=1292 RepID=UPI00325FED55